MICNTFLADFDEDNEIGRSDLNKILRCLTRNELTEKEMSFVVDKVRFEIFITRHLYIYQKDALCVCLFVCLFVQV